MKKIIAAALCAALLLSAAGCSRRKKQPYVTTDTNTETSVSDRVTHETTADVTSAVTTAAASSVATDTVSANTPVTVKYETFENQNNSVTLKYPVFGDAAHGDADAAIRDFVYGRYISAGMFPEEFDSYEITDVEVMYSGERLVSALFVGQIIGENGEEHFAYTLNLGLSPVRVYETAELLTSNTALYDSFVSGKFTLVRGNGALLSDMTVGDIAYAFRPELGVYPGVYLKGSTFGVVCEVPQVYGGYAAFECDTNALDGVISPAAASLTAGSDNS